MAYFQLAGYYAQGIKGMSQDWSNANELLRKAGELGHAEAYCKLDCLYGNWTGCGKGLEES